MNILLTTRRLILRPLQESDAAAMFAYRSRPDVSRYQVWCPADETEIRGFIGKQRATVPDTPGTWFSLAITLRDTGEMIGDIGLHFPEHEPAQMEVGITLSPGFRKRGFAGEALEEAIRLAFFSLGKERVFASVDPRNLDSIRMLERAGMGKEAYFRGRMIIRGELVDDAVYSIRKSDFRGEGRV
jgi:RimJ/RimL family protein N-acetyltransferase